MHALIFIVAAALAAFCAAEYASTGDALYLGLAIFNSATALFNLVAMAVFDR